MRDTAARLGEIRAGLDDARRRFGEMQDHMLHVADELAPGRFEGRDRSGSVTVTITGQGRVSDVAIAPRWRSKLTSPGLAAAVVDAYEAATRAFADGESAALAAAGLAEAGDGLLAARREPGEAMDQRAYTASDTDEAPLFLPRDPAQARALDVLMRQAEAVRGIGADLARGVAAAVDDSGATGEDSSGHVAVRFGQHGELRDVRLDAGWLARTEPAGIAATIGETLRDVQARSLDRFAAMTDAFTRAAARIEELEQS